MYIYEINKDNYLVNCCEVENLKAGLIENHKLNPWVNYQNAWVDENRLQLNNLDGSYKYKIEDNNLTVIPCESESDILVEKAEKLRRQQIVSEIRKEYTIDDEIAFIYVNDNDPDKMKYRAYVNKVKGEING